MKAAHEPNKKSAAKPLSPKLHLDGLIAKVDRKHRALFVSVRRALRKRFPSANELVYDYSHALVIGYSPSEHGIESIVVLWAGADGTRLYLLNGPKLPDPNKVLQGSGKQARFVKLETLESLKLPEVEALLVAAVDGAKTPFSPSGVGKLITKTDRSKKKPKPKRKAARPK